MEREDCRVCCLKIPAGFRFDPWDEELVAYYLREKIEGRPLQCNHLITELQIYHDDFLPWEIIKDDNPYWITSSSDWSNKNKIKKTIYVFTELRKRKTRVIRRSGRGSWTGQNNLVVKNRAGDDIGYNKFLTFCKDSDGKKGKKKKIADGDDQEHGHWMMHEYSLFGIDNYVLCKIIKEVRISAKASELCPTKAAPSQDFLTQGDLHIMNVVSEDQERQSGDGDQILDDFTTDWDKNGWAELYQEFVMDFSNDQELPVHSQPITFDDQEDKNMVCNNQIPDFLVEEEAFAVVNQPSDQSGADLYVNGQNSVLHERYGTADNHNRTGVSHDTSAGVGVVQELPVFGVMDNHQQGQVIQNISLDETVAGCSLFAAFTSNEIFDDFRNFELVGDDPAFFDDFRNFELVGDDPAFLPTNSIWDGSDVILDFSSHELVHLWPDESIQESCSIFEIQPGKRMRSGEEDCVERPSGKKQHCL